MFNYLDQEAVSTLREGVRDVESVSAHPPGAQQREHGVSRLRQGAHHLQPQQAHQVRAQEAEEDLRHLQRGGPLLQHQVCSWFYIIFHALCTK